MIENADLDLTGEEALLVVTLQRKHGLPFEVAMDVVELASGTLLANTRCAAITSTGKRCRMIAVDGKPLCTSHDRMGRPESRRPRREGDEGDDR